MSVSDIKICRSLAQKQITAAFSATVHAWLNTQAAGNCRCVQQGCEDIIWHCSADNQVAATCNWQTGLMSSICGKKKKPRPMRHATPAYFRLQSIIKLPLQFIFNQRINLRVVIRQFIFILLQPTDLKNDSWYYIRWFCITQKQIKE